MVNNGSTSVDAAKALTKVGVILAPGFAQELAALKFLILHQNTVQRSVEYQIFPVPDNWALGSLLATKGSLERRAVEQEMKSTKAPYMEWLREVSGEYRADLEEPDAMAIVSMATFADNYYTTWVGNWALLALGNWKRHMAPPSALEFIQSFLVNVAVDVACGKKWPRRHLGTKGCMNDFTALLDDARFGVLTGFICHRCETWIADTCSERFLADVQTLAKLPSLGDASSPTVAAHIIKNLGFDLFRTRGIRPTAWERLRDFLEEEAIKALFKILGAVLLAGLLVWFGFQEGSQP